MAEDEARADRIRQLKTSHPDMTWAYIAEQVGVRERSAAQWQKSGGISTENAKKLARVFDVTWEWLYFGEEQRPAPDLMKAVSDRVASNLTMTEDIRAEFLGYVETIIAEVKRNRLEIEEQNKLLAQQSQLLEQQSALIAELRAVVAVLPAIERVLDLLPEDDVVHGAQQTGGEVAELPPAAEDRSRDIG